LDQWRKRIGKTSLLDSTKIYYTVGGDSTPQRRDVEDTAKQHHDRKIDGSSQLKLRARDPDVANSSHRGLTGSSKVPEPDTSLHERTRKKLNNQVWRSKSVLSFSAPKAVGVATQLPLRKRPVVDATQAYHNRSTATPKLKESSRQLPKSSQRVPPNKQSIQMVDRIEPVNLADKSSKRKYSAEVWAVAKKEAKSLTRENTTIQDTHPGKINHSTVNRNSGKQSKEGKIVGTPDLKTEIRPQIDTTPYIGSELSKNVENRRRVTLRPKSKGAFAVAFKTCIDETEGSDIEGKFMGARSDNSIIDKWCSQSTDNWITDMRRKLDSQEEAKGTNIPLDETITIITSQYKQRMTQKAEVTMSTNGTDEVLVQNIYNKPAFLRSPSIWNLNGRSIENILDNQESIKEDQNLLMPHMEADATQKDSNLSPIPKEGKLASNRVNKRNVNAEYLKHLTSVCITSFPADKSPGSPSKYWIYVHKNDEKSMVKNRWMGYDPSKIYEKIANLQSKRKISNEKLYAYPYFWAQLLTIMGRYKIKESVGATPLIHERLTHIMELLPGSKPIREKPQKLPENQCALNKVKFNNLSQNELIKNPPLYSEMSDIIIVEPDINPGQMNSNENEDRKTQPLRNLNWTQHKYIKVINEYMKHFQPSEGRLYAHPRIRRIYEITTENFLSQLDNHCCLLTGNGWWDSNKNNTFKSFELLVNPKDLLESHGIIMGRRGLYESHMVMLKSRLSLLFSKVGTEKMCRPELDRYLNI